MTQGRDHSIAIIHSTHLLVKYLGEPHYASCQLAIETRRYSEPKPDFALCERSAVDDPGQRAMEVLVIEVSNTSLIYDRKDKSSIYAAAGIPEYWIRKLRQRCLEIHCEPDRMKGRPFRHGYHSVAVLDENAQVSPLFRPDVSVSVAEML